MPTIDPPFLWLLIGLLLAAAELMTGGLVLLALGVAAIGVAVLAWFGIGLNGQLIGMAVLSGILVPVAVKWIRPRFSPQGVGYGTTGAGTERGRLFTVCRRDFDGALGVKINGDFYRARLDNTEAPDSTGASALAEGQPVRFVRFDGTTALVRLPDPTDPPLNH